MTSGQAGRGELGALALGASLGVDAISAGGASLGGFAAEKLAPNELGYRVFGEVSRGRRSGPCSNWRFKNGAIFTKHIWLRKKPCSKTSYAR